MTNPRIPLKNTTINSFGTFLSRVSGVFKFNVVNYFFGANADTFHSAYNNILSLRKVFGEGSLVNAFLPIFSKVERVSDEEASRFASNIFTQIIIVSILITIISIFITPLYVKIFLPGFADQTKEFNEIVAITVIMLLSVVFFSVFSIAMGLLNAKERFFTSSFSPIIANIIFVIFPVLFHKSLGIISLGWALVLGTFAQFVVESIELYMIGYRYQFVLDFKNQYSRYFWKQFLPVSLNFVLQSGISVGLGFFASFLPKGSMTYLRNANTVINAPVGFIGVAISGTIFPVFAKHKHDFSELAKSFVYGMIFFLFTAVPIVTFFYIYTDIIIYTIFRDISRLFSGSTGKYTEELINSTIRSTRCLSTVVLPWSAVLIINKLFYSIEKPSIPLYLILVNFGFNIVGYSLSQYFGWGGLGLVYADLISGWFTFIVSMVIIIYYLPEVKGYLFDFFKYACIFSILSCVIWALLSPLHKIYKQTTSPLFLLCIGGTMFCIGLILFYFGAHAIKKNPITKNL